MSYDYSGRPTYDGRDDLERTRRLVEWNKRPGPRVGDFVQFLDGTRGRFTHDWHTEIQTTSRNPATRGDQSFYFGLGYVEFSGSLGAPIKKTRLRLVEGEQPEGRFWFFHHNNARAHNGVSFAVPCRLFEEIEKEEEEETESDD